MLLNGTAIANTILDRLANELRTAARIPHLAAVIVGDDPALKAFVRIKKKAAEAVGMQFSSYEFPGDATEEQVAEMVRWLAADSAVDGIFVELPLPEQFSAAHILDLIPPEKDPDVLSAAARAKGASHRLRILSPAVRALELVLADQHIDVRGMQAVVVGNGDLVGAPIAAWLKQQGANVDSVDEATAHPEQRASRADILICGTGKPGLVAGTWVKEGAVVIDYGYGKRSDGTVVGDVDAASVASRAKLLTPVPGGMGPLVVAAVLENLVALTLPEA